MKVCERCGESFKGQVCSCGYQQQADQPDHLRMASGNLVPQCTWITVNRCCLPASGHMPGQPLRCHWHLHWAHLTDMARTLEESTERPAFDAWWDWRADAYHGRTSWGLNKEEYWRYAHGQRIHDEKPETLPAPTQDHAYLSRDEFGQDLFNAIKAQAGAIQALKTADIMSAKGKEKAAKEYAAHAVGLQRELEMIFKRNTIEPDDIRRILKMQ